LAKVGLATRKYTVPKLGNNDEAKISNLFEIYRSKFLGLGDLRNSLNEGAGQKTSYTRSSSTFKPAD
jgi:hypothetical protein